MMTLCIIALVLCIACMTMNRLGALFIKPEDLKMQRSYLDDLPPYNYQTDPNGEFMKARMQLNDAYVDEQFHNIQRRAKAEEAIQRYDGFTQN